MDRRNALKLVGLSALFVGSAPSLVGAKPFSMPIAPITDLETRLLESAKLGDREAAYTIFMLKCHARSRGYAAS